MLKRYFNVQEQQTELLKLKTKAELFGPEKTPEKSAYQANLSEI